MTALKPLGSAQREISLRHSLFEEAIALVRNSAVGVLVTAIQVIAGSACRNFSAICLVCLMVTMAAGREAVAFDTGHHFDLTRVVLKRQGLGIDAVNSVLMANWLTDYHSNAPAVKNLLLKTALNRLHFDNLSSRQQVEDYYHAFRHNLRMLIEEAARENDRIKFLISIGIGVHIIQDFYAHSNWAELYPRRSNGEFDIDLFPRPTVLLKGKLRTGKWPLETRFSHGNYTYGMNKDSPIRPNWDNAFVLAHAATWRLAREMRNWAEAERPGFWQHTASLHLTDKNRMELLRDLNSAHEISMWVKAKVLGLPASDGHWKGNRTGHASRFTTANNAFTKWKNSFLSRQFRETDIATRMALNLKK